MVQRALVGVWAMCAFLTLNATAIAATSTPYTGTAFAVPGAIESENFDDGGEGIAYHDLTAGNSLGAFRQTDVDIEASTEGGYDIAKIRVGEWLKYSVNVSSTNNYVLEARVASYGQGGTFHIEFADKDVTGPLTVPNTNGWQNWTTLSTKVALSAGPQTMRVVFDTAGPSGVGNLNWVRVSPVPSTPFTGAAVAAPGTIQAVNFDNGGEGAAYHDTTAGNNGGQYRNTDVDIEPSSLGGYNVGWMTTGEWLAYSVNVTTAGTYTLKFQVASKAGGGQLHASFGPTNTTTVAVPSTSAWQNWTTVTTTANLTAGVQVMKLIVDTGGFNVAGITLALTTPSTPAPAVPSSPNPADGNLGVTVTPNLSWQAAGATSYDLKLGTSNPPATYVANISTYYYAPATLVANTKYYWQVVAKNDSGSTTGPVWSFTTEGGSTPPPPSTAPTGVPTSYNAPSDRLPKPKPALPALGPAGFTFTDPAFGSKMVRVTDANTRPTSPNVSFRSPSASPQVAWNATSTLLYVVSTDGTVVPFAFDANTMKASRVPGAGDGGLVLNFNNEPTFSAANPNVIYGIAVGGNNRTITKYDFSTGTYSTVVDLDTTMTGLAGTYTGAMMVGGTSTEYLSAVFGGAGQDLHHYLMWTPVNNLGGRKIVDTMASTLNGLPTNILLNFRLHALVMDRSGRYVFMYPTAPDLAAPRYASPAYLWDTTTDIITAITTGGNDGGPDAHGGGHSAAGFGYYVNHDCCVSTSWDGAQWELRSLAAPLAPWDLITPVLTPKEVYLSDHPTWNNAQPDSLVPVIVGTYRYGINTAEWRAWDDELIAVETNAPAGTTATVWRFAHHRSNIASDTNAAALNFWYTPRPNVSPNGRWAIFTSNWEKTLGTDSRDGTYRQDVFIVQLQ